MSTYSVSPEALAVSIREVPIRIDVFLSLEWSAMDQRVRFASLVYCSNILRRWRRVWPICHEETAEVAGSMAKLFRPNRVSNVCVQTEQAIFIFTEQATLCYIMSHTLT